jgi:solute carrier family 45, member 1/2/4
MLGMQVKSTTIFLAVLSIYAVDFAINAVQASCRSLVVDTLPIPKQQLGSAWGECRGNESNQLSD